MLHTSEVNLVVATAPFLMHKTEFLTLSKVEIPVKSRLHRWHHIKTMPSMPWSPSKADITMQVIIYTLSPIPRGKVVNPNISGFPRFWKILENPGKKRWLWKVMEKLWNHVNYRKSYGKPLKSYGKSSLCSGYLCRDALIFMGWCICSFWSKVDGSDEITEPQVNNQMAKYRF